DRAHRLGGGRPAVDLQTVLAGEERADDLRAPAGDGPAARAGTALEVVHEHLRPGARARRRDEREERERREAQGACAAGSDEGGGRTRQALEPTTAYGTSDAALPRHAPRSVADRRTQCVARCLRRGLLLAGCVAIQRVEPDGE